MKHEQETTRGCRGRGAISVCLAIAGALTWLSPAQAEVTEDSFHAQTTNDMVAVCSVSQTDPLYSAAINFCHGFTVGSYQVLHELMAAEPKLRLFCVTEPGPTRNESIAAFLTWVQAHPEQGTKVPAESIAAFLAERYPCPQVAASKPKPAKKH
jgi:hypothetical protein